MISYPVVFYETDHNQGIGLMEPVYPIENFICRNELKDQSRLLVATNK